jgi:hypothetical protein
MELSSDTFGGPYFSRDLFQIPGRLGRFCGGGGRPPPQTAAQKQTEALQMELMSAQLAASKNPVKMPEIAVPPPAAAPPPPPSQTGSDVLSAEQEARRQAARRKGIQSTLLTSKNSMNLLGGAQSLLG